MSVYDGDSPKAFDESLQSIKKQSLEASELILIENGLISKELQNCIDYYRKSINIFTIKMPKNLGLSLALKKGMAACNQNFIARMDADDICAPDRFKTQHNFLSKNPDVDVVGSWITEFEDDPRKIINYRRLPLHHDKIATFSKTRCPFNHMTVMFRKKAVLAAGGYNDYPIAQDYNLWVRMLVNGSHFANLPEYLVNVRCGKGSVARRSGFRRVKYDIKNQIDFLNLGFIGPVRFITNITLRCTVRMLPQIILKSIYKVAWR
ncbi:glycosyltransferase [Desulfonatronum thioautotrophicum]|uniref:glycosyltransferase n=1 Tax=Desulfonatronum thioautotrophicum TaxID=617001 RepID=UPI0013792A5B|nr:glycosyltransferase [Desulfonatronum thioautotrophicum]